ncbi:MAG: hypothetical protein CMM07_25630 [Rhodopirellula sp.]|nr:hypothetical protein [Rhodopirellula sp.]
MATLNTMRNALAGMAVKHMGGGIPIPELEFVMHPHRLQDAIHESRINDLDMVSHPDGNWTFRGVPIREDKDVSNWRLSAVDKTPCGECHLKPNETCDICGAHQPHE